MALRRAALGTAAFLLLAVLTACSTTRHVNLAQVADRAGVRNATTADGTYERHQATGIHSAREIGLAIGLPGLGRLRDITPARSDEDLLVEAVTDMDNRADGLIQVRTRGCYTGFPFILLGVYVDHAEATAIRSIPDGGSPSLQSPAGS